MNEPSPPRERRTVLVIWLILSQLLTVASLLGWIMVAGFSVMALDSGGSIGAWAFIIAVWSYPIIALILVIAAWKAFTKRKNKLAAVLSGLSFAPPLLFYGFLSL